MQTAHQQLSIETLSALRWMFVLPHTTSHFLDLDTVAQNGNCTIGRADDHRKQDERMGATTRPV